MQIHQDLQTARGAMGVATYLQNARKLAIGLMILALPLAAQTGLGVVQGTVQDSSRAVIPNAKVTLTNTDTGVGRDSLTNSAGIYYFGSVPIGPYLLAIEAAGFKKCPTGVIVRSPVD